MNQTLFMFLFIGFFVFLLWFGLFIFILLMQKLNILTSPNIFKILHFAGILIPLVMGLTMFFSRNTWSSINAAFYTASSAWIVIVTGLFLSAVFGFIVLGLINILGITAPAKLLGVLFFSLGLSFSIYGFINSSIIRTKNIVLSDSNLASLSGSKIAVVADLHIGLVRRRNFVEKVTNKIMQQNPDMIIIAGDLIDGPVFPYAEFLEPLNKLSAPKGVYFTPGNHETYNSELAKVYEAIPKNVTILSDSSAKIPGTDILITGFEYDTESKEHFKERAERIIGGNTPQIGILHDPKHRDLLGNLGIPLVVSGHTHGGQFFPGTLVVKMIYKEKTSGVVQHKNGVYFTTTGVGTAVSPARVDTNPEIVVLDLK